MCTQNAIATKKTQLRNRRLKINRSSYFESDPAIPEEEREPQFFDNQIANHIIQEAITLPRRVSETRSIGLTQMYKQRASQHKNRQQTTNK